ncbi:MAG TPA: LuxR C-terminal-related transcriptional regulator [Gemmatimonadaceae bacterium]
MTEVELLNALDDEPALRLLLTIAVVVIIVGGGIDLAYDAPSSWLSGHVFYELALIACGVAIAVAFWRGWRHAARSLTDARRALVERQAERDEWRSSARQALEGLGHAIEAQFESWALTPTEREIALLLLKGHSHKAIAYATGRSERTVRQHAVAVYQKSGLGGRAELAAFFLEDLMLPDADRELSHARPEPPAA